MAHTCTSPRNEKFSPFPHLQEPLRQNCFRPKLQLVCILRQTVAALILVLSFGVPTMACAIPGATQTASERECCERMAHKCDSMLGADSCCRTELRSTSDCSEFIGAPGHTPFDPVITSAPADLIELSTPLQLGQMPWRIVAFAHSPPGVIDNTILLRI
jgi:hypothetical protein